jgi:hypothetical protein
MKRYRLIGLALVAALVTACQGGSGSDSRRTPALLPALYAPITTATAIDLTVVATLPGFDDPVTALAFSPDGALLASGTAGGSVRLWDTATGANLDSLWVEAEPRPAVTGIVFNPDEATLTAAYADNLARVWHVDQGELVATLTAPKTPPADSATAPGGSLYVTAEPTGTLRLWDADSGQVVAEKPAAVGGAALAVAFSADGLVLASAGVDGVIRLWGVVQPDNLVTLLFSEEELNRLIAEALADVREIEMATVNLNPAGYGDVVFSADVLGRRMDGTARVTISYAGDALALQLDDVRLARIAAPDTIVHDINAELARVAAPLMNEAVAMTVRADSGQDTAYVIYTVTFDQDLLTITVRPLGEE